MIVDIVLFVKQGLYLLGALMKRQFEQNWLKLIVQLYVLLFKQSYFICVYFLKFLNH